MACTQKQFAIEQPVTKIAWAPSEPSQAALNSRYGTLWDIVITMEDFSDDLIHQPMPHWGPGEEARKTSWLKSRQETYKIQQAFITHLKEVTLCLLEQAIDIDQYLFHLLDCRYAYLRGRDQSIKSLLQLPSKYPEKMLFPTDKTFFDFFMQDSAFTGHIHSNEMCRLRAVHRFELLNLLIKETFSLCSLEALRQETITFLQGDVQLHPILTGERQDLGHPDEAGGPYSLLYPIIMAYLYPGRPVTKQVQQLMHLLRPDQKQKLYRTHAKQHTNFFLSAALFSELEKMEKPGCKEAELVLSLKKGLDLYLHEADEETFFSRFRGIGAPPTQGVMVSRRMAGVWPYELPNPAFLQKKPLPPNLIHHHPPQPP